MLSQINPNYIGFDGKQTPHTKADTCFFLYDLKLIKFDLFRNAWCVAKPLKKAKAHLFYRFIFGLKLIRFDLFLGSWNGNPKVF